MLRLTGLWCFLLALLQNPAFAGTCAPDLLKPAPTYDQIYARLKQGRGSDRGFLTMPESPDALKSFWLSGWAYLKMTAEENDTSIAELLDDYFAMMDLVESATPSVSPELLQRYRQQTKNIENAILQLQDVPLSAKLKRRHWDMIRQVTAGLSSLGLLVIRIESLWKDSPSFNPVDPFDGATMRAFLDAIELVNLDHVTELLRRREIPQLQDSGSAEDTTLDTPEPDLPSPPPPTDRPASDPSSLEQVLLFGGQLQPASPYNARTAFGRDLTVTLSDEIVETSNSGQGEIVRRLLRSIMTGRNHRSGIKALFDLGPNIVELKTVMHGHKRIFGCLDGSALRLKRFVEISDSRSAYARRIGPDFCSDL